MDGCVLKILPLQFNNVDIVHNVIFLLRLLTHSVKKPHKMKGG
jgi:hypothetical protein